MTEEQPKNPKIEQLEQHKVRNSGEPMREDSGNKVADDEQTLRAGRRGPSLLQDTHFYRKQSHFNRERIPEKVVHARGFGVHGIFELTNSMSAVTKADFLQEPGMQTPVFVRFSNFIGSRGSKDTAIDVRGFATKFYTREGNYDSLALSFAVFIIKDAMKFADLTHAIKPDPATDVPQAAAAHDSLWDYVANNQESAHMIMWLMSMRGRPRSWRMMQAWPINTFRLINDDGDSTFARFVWKPLLGVHGLLLEEANVLGGVDPDYHRHDIIEAIQKGAYPEYELGVQLIKEEDEFAYDFDLLDDTKMWPEETIPVHTVGKMTLNRLVDNFFAEEEQSSFDPSTLVPGIEFSNDPVLQGRSFAYRDTDYHRLGTANINDIPINQPLMTAHYNQRDGHVRHRIDADSVDYHNNSLAVNTPSETPAEEGGRGDYPTAVEGHVTREHPSSGFHDHFSQARIFWNSMSPPERADMIRTFVYHLGKVKSRSVQQQNVDMFANVDEEMAGAIADAIGAERPNVTHVPVSESSPALSIANTAYSALTQRVGVIAGNDFAEEEVQEVLDGLTNAGAFVHVISDRLTPLRGTDGMELAVDESFITAHPALFDAYYVLGGRGSDPGMFTDQVEEFVRNAYKSLKPIAIAPAAEDLVPMESYVNPVGVITGGRDFAERFVSAVAQQRFWDRA